MPRQNINLLSADALSPVARQVLMLDLPEAYRRLVVDGHGNPHARSMLEGATGERLLSMPVASHDDATAMLAGLWLWHDWLEESHRLAQAVTTPTGSFWHAIMHRREGDFGNSRYWYARCAGHPVMQAMIQHAAPILHPMPADNILLRLIGREWNPSAFVDLVETVHDQPNDPRHAAAVSLQQVEWRLLFDFCTRSAVR